MHLPDAFRAGFTKSAGIRDITDRMRLVFAPSTRKGLHIGGSSGRITGSGERPDLTKRRWALPEKKTPISQDEMDRAKEHFAKSAFKFPKTEAMMNALVWPIAAGVGINMGTTAIMKATHSDDEPSVDRKRIESLVRTQVAKMVNQGGMP